MKSLLNAVIKKLFGKKIPKTSENYVPYAEEDTECDKCYKKNECIEKGYLVNSTFSQDTREHYIKGRFCVCVKGCEEFLEMKLSEILEITDTEDMKKFIEDFGNFASINNVEALTENLLKNHRQELSKSGTAKKSTKKTTSKNVE